MRAHSTSPISLARISLFSLRHIAHKKAHLLLLTRHRLALAHYCAPRCLCLFCLCYSRTYLCLRRGHATSLRTLRTLALLCARNFCTSSALRFVGVVALTPHLSPLPSLTALANRYNARIIISFYAWRISWRMRAISKMASLFGYTTSAHHTPHLRRACHTSPRTPPHSRCTLHSALHSHTTCTSAPALCRTPLHSHAFHTSARTAPALHSMHCLTAPLSSLSIHCALLIIFSGWAHLVCTLAPQTPHCRLPRLPGRRALPRLPPASPHLPASCHLEWAGETTGGIGRYVERH